jgi:hypothetical protein
MTGRAIPIDRRLALGLGVGAGTLALVAGLWPSIFQQAPADIPALLKDVCDQVIPDTATPGAVAARVPEFVLQALSVGIGGARGDELSRFSAELGEDYPNAEHARRQELLAHHDAAAFAAIPPKGAWPMIKKLVVLGYYTSEIGGSRELAYELDPGGFKPDVSCGPGSRAWSNDWLSLIL